MNIGNTIVDVIQALFAAVLEFAAWAFVCGWFFVALGALFLVLGRGGQSRAARSRFFAILLLLLGLALMWWNGANAFNAPLRGFQNAFSHFYSY